MTTLKDSYTSTGHKFFAHQEAMRKLANGKSQPITTHIMPTDRCNHSCAFCSVQTREGDVLPLQDMLDYLDILLKYGLKSVIVSGGGNPILYRCPTTGRTFNHLIEHIHRRGLQIGLITNGAPLRAYKDDGCGVRLSWKMVEPRVLDMLTWVRISCSGFDHEENEVFVPDIDPTKTTLGFSYVLHDLYDAPHDPHHGKVSTPTDLIALGTPKGTLKPTWWAKDRLPALTMQLGGLVSRYNPKYVRLLPNCLEPSLIPERCEILQRMADEIDPDVVFVQYKPPAPPNHCFLGYVHPVLNSDGYVYPCDSCVLNDAAGHKFGASWRICHWRDVEKVYNQPVRSLIDDPKKLCPGCVFTQSNLLLESVVRGEAIPPPPSQTPTHVNFI